MSDDLPEWALKKAWAIAAAHPPGMPVSYCVEDIARALVAARRAGEWQPIETAPKGTPFLAAEYAPTNWAYRVRHIDWREGSPEQLWEMQTRYCRFWMPLPEEPTP